MQRRPSGQPESRRRGPPDRPPLGFRLAPIPANSRGGGRRRPGTPWGPRAVRRAGRLSCGAREAPNSATRQQCRRAKCDHGERPQHPQPDECLHKHGSQEHGGCDAEQSETKRSRGERSNSVCRSGRRQICDEPVNLVTVATSQHCVDALLAFFEAQSPLSNRVRNKPGGLLAFEIRSEYWLRHERTFVGERNRDG